MPKTAERQARGAVLTAGGFPPSADKSDAGIRARVARRLLLASPNESFRSIFGRYFTASGYTVDILRKPGLADTIFGSREVALLVLDEAFFDESPQGDWRGVVDKARSARVPVLAAAPREKTGTSGEACDAWAEDVITYPMNPEAVLRKVVKLTGDARAAGTPSERTVGTEAMPDESVGLLSDYIARLPSDAGGGDGRALWRALARCRLVLDQIRDAVFVFARTGQLAMVNDAACRILGYDRQEVLGRSPGVVFSQIDNPPSVNGLDLRKAMSRFAVPAFDTALRTASGSSVPVSFRTSFLRDEQDNIVGILGIATDIRERKVLEEHLRRHNELLEEEVARRTGEICASEERYRTVLANVTTGIIGTDVRGHVESINRAACSILQLDEQEAVGRPLRDLWTCRRCEGCSGPRGCEGCLEDVAGPKGTVRFPRQCCISNKDGRKITILKNLSVLRRETGEAYACIHTLTDLSPQVQVQEELERTRTYLDLVVRGKRRNHRIVGRSRAIQSVLDFIAASAESSATVLIEGESGTGKELVAETLHMNSSRASRPWLVVNCANLSGPILESELFGHERGAFTGAVVSKRGLLEVVDSGTLFIDEIADMPLSAQAKILRVLENGSFRRVGGTKGIRVDVRFVAATNRHLAEEVKKGRFREDLFYRLNVLRVEVPPLRRRVEDIPLLVAHLLDNTQVTAAPGIKRRFSPRAVDLMIRYSWPGNVRELRNVVEHAVILSREKALLDDVTLPHELLSAPKRTSVQAEGLTTLKQIQNEHIERVLAATDGNKTRAAKILGLSVRQLRRVVNARRTSIPIQSNR
ncbi:MAG: sigma 54-interacting transcriptional regulator [Planctomycetota bacterium]|jgi:PAS domain S-box-containing protein